MKKTLTLDVTDGGRQEAGFSGGTRDCVTRAIAVATGIPYLQVYEEINTRAKKERRGKKSSARTGVFRGTYEKYLISLGWKWTPTMHVGRGCKVHLRADELPVGQLIVKLSKHLCAVSVFECSVYGKYGVIHDTHDPSRDGTRCVYGYFSR